MPQGGVFHAQRVERPAPVVDPRRAPPQQPEATALVEVSSIARPVPTRASDAEFVLRIAGAVKITQTHVIAEDDELARVARRLAKPIELGRAAGPDLATRLILQNTKLNDGHGIPGKQAVSIQHRAGLPRAIAATAGMQWTLMKFCPEMPLRFKREEVSVIGRTNSLSTTRLASP